MNTDKFINERKYLKAVTPCTLAWYKQSFKAFEDALETTEEIKQRIVELRERGTKPVSINTYLRAVKAYWLWQGKKWEVGHLNEESKILSTFSPHQVNQFLKSRPGRTHTLVCLLFDSGLRISEALSLKKEDIDLDGFTLRVLGKGGKHRLVPFSAEFRKILFRYLVKFPSQNYVFATRNNTKLTVRNFLRDFKKLGHQLGVKNVRISPHTCRHSFAVNWLRRGGNLYSLQRILGHSSITTTERYCRSLGIEDIIKEHSSRSLLCG